MTTMAKLQHNIQGVKISTDFKTLSILVASEMEASMLYPLLTEAKLINLFCNLVNHYFDLSIYLTQVDHFELNYDLNTTTKNIAYAIDLNLIVELQVCYYLHQHLEGYASAIPLHRN
jgi:hypothetical protein